MKDHTVIIVAHRLTTIRNVDRILVFENGKIVEEGNYDKLVSSDGKFKELLTFKND
jgi:ATP-binding cassette subfamily B protein